LSLSRWKLMKLLVAARISTAAIKLNRQLYRGYLGNLR
jgi:hypothetical protein